MLEGVSRRYTATVLIALADEPAEVAHQALAGHSPDEVCANLTAQLSAMTDPGEAALTLWAARALGSPQADQALERMAALWTQAAWPTVETAWALSALCAGDAAPANADLAAQAADRLLGCFNRRSGLFAHWPSRQSSSFLRGHVTCFADFVYPVQALSFYSRALGAAEPLKAAAQCAERMCALQGPQGQWWWHFDVRTGRVVERYPVYAVHQDAMAPMALRALRDAGGPDLMEHADRGLAWLASTPELNGGSLVDAQADVIWRKVARREPGKLSRGLQAVVSRLHPALRAPGVNLLFRPRAVDYESRPYHMGWILYAWPRGASADATSTQAGALNVPAGLAMTDGSDSPSTT